MADPLDMSGEATRLWGALIGMAGFIVAMAVKLIGPWTATIRATEQFAASQQAMAHAVDSSAADQRRTNDQIMARLTRIEMALNLQAQSPPSSPDRPLGG